ncbi:MAG: nuclear transport factor 2 family protein [Hyphomicrobiales bacterium]
MTTASVAEQILSREQMRCKAVMAADIETLSGLVASDLVHVHVTARVNTRDEHLDGIKSRSEYKSVTREDMKVRDYGDIAVATGILINVHRLQNMGEDWRTTRAFVTQVWKRTPDGWKQVSFQATKVA